jgi:hypothetical protein
MDSLRWLVDLARRAGALRLTVNGSFVTDRAEPNDVDCVLLIGPGFPHDAAAEKERPALYRTEDGGGGGLHVADRTHFRFGSAGGAEGDD